MTEYFQHDSWKYIAQQDLPFMATPREVIESIFQFLKEHKLISSATRLLDLGAGDGRIIIYAAEIMEIYSMGVEINLELIETARQQILARGLQDRCQMVEQDLYNFDVEGFDIIFCFILPSNHRYFRHVVEQITPGSTIICVRWALEPFENLMSMKHTLTTNPQFPAYIYQKAGSKR